MPFQVLMVSVLLEFVKVSPFKSISSGTLSLSISWVLAIFCYNDEKFSEID